jgi:F-type H+-transporting ATPase subunit gamma
MAGGQERVLRRRIRSVQSTRKITKAMELIAASRIVRAQNRIAANRPYRLGMEKILRITAAADPAAAKRLLGTPESPQTVGILAIVGDRGLAGSYNSGVFRATERLVNEHVRNGAAVTLWTVGKKAPSYFRYRGIPVERSFPGIADRPEFVDARAIAATVTGPFVAGEMELVQLVSSLAPRAAESEIFAALLEGAASFFTAQQRAMAAATDNADELVRTLTRVMNRARQDAITTEIMEIVGGAEALRQTKGA